LLKYRETNWKYESGFDIHKYDLTISVVDVSRTRKEQQARIEKISLVAFLNKEQRKFFVNICRHLKRDDKDFYQNKYLYATLFGFGPLKKRLFQRHQKNY